MAAWNTEELEYLKANWGKKPIKKIAEYLGRTKNSVSAKAAISNLGRSGFSTHKHIEMGIHYKAALAPEQWSRAECFVKIMAQARQVSLATGMKPRINIKELQSIFAQIERRMPI